MATTGFFHDEQTLWHGPGTPFAAFVPVGRWVEPLQEGLVEAPETKRRIKSLLDVSGLTTHLVVKSAAPASEADLLRVHTSDYLRRFKEGSDAGGGDMGDLAPFGPGSYEIAKVSAGLAIAAAEDVWLGAHSNAYALCRPPGHHVGRDRGMGFCLLNNIAVAIEAIKERHGAGRIAVIDWDVHHGNGTQQLFYERDDVLTISLHQENCFPPFSGAANELGAGRGLGFNINLPLLPGGGSSVYAYAFERVILPAVNRFRPNMIIVASGFDANASDPLSRMQLGPEDFRSMMRWTKELAEQHAGGRLVAIHEGGYCKVSVPFCALAAVEELSGIRTEVPDVLSPLVAIKQASTAFDILQRRLIDEMAALHGL
jgi:acetoin utilization deacetylase AcuC-like enzyme